MAGNPSTNPVAAAATAATTAASNAAAGAVQGAGSWASNLLGAPFRWVASLPGKMFGALGGAVQGAMSSLSGGFIATGAIAALKFLSPELWRSVDVAMGGEKRAAETAAMVERDGVAGILFDSAKQGFLLAGAAGAAGGAVSKAGLIPGGALVAGVATVALGALSAPKTPASGGASAGTEPRVA